VTIFEMATGNGAKRIKYIMSSTICTILLIFGVIKCTMSFAICTPCLKFDAIRYTTKFHNL
jgi:hypothetical protein